MNRGRPPTHCREALLDIGNSLFQLHGYHGTSLNMILDACAVSRGSFYNYFGGKESYAIEIIEHYHALEINRWTEEYTRLQGRHADKVELMMRRMIEEFSMTNERIGCLLANLSGDMALASENFRKAIRNAIGRVLHAITEDMQLCQDEGSVRTDLTAQQLANMIWDYWQGALLRMKTENSRAPLYQAIDLLWQYLLPPQTSLKAPKSEA